MLIIIQQTRRPELNDALKLRRVIDYRPDFLGNLERISGSRPITCGTTYPAAVDDPHVVQFTKDGHYVLRGQSIECGPHRLA